MPDIKDDNEVVGDHGHAGEDVTTGTVADGRLSSKVLLDDSSHTLTNKSYDANGTGNVLSNVEDGDIASAGLTTTALSATAAITKAQISNTGAWGIAEIPDNAKKIALVVAVTDEAGALSTGNAKITFRMPFSMAIDEVRGMLSVAGTGAALVTVDVNDDAVSMFSTVVTIDASETTSETAAAASVLTSTPLTVADDSIMTVDIDIIDTDNVAKGLKIVLIGQRNT